MSYEVTGPMEGYIDLKNRRHCFLEAGTYSSISSLRPSCAELVLSDLRTEMI